MASMTLAERAILVTLNLRQWIGEREDKGVTAEVLERYGAEDDSGKFRKLLLAKGATQNLRKLACEIRNRYYELTVPWDDTGRRIIGTEMHHKLSAEMESFHERWDNGVADFIGHFPQYVSEAERSRGGLFRITDYPTQDQLVNRFEFRLRYHPVPESNHIIAKISADALREIKSEVDADAQEYLNRAMGTVTGRIRDAVGHMSDRLKTFSPDAEVECPKCDGTGHVTLNGGDGVGEVTATCAKCLGNRTVRAVKNPFRDSLVENIRELIDLIPGLNIAGDPRITQLADDMRRNLLTHSAAELRESDASRTAVAAEADAILSKMSAYGF